MAVVDVDRVSAKAATLNPVRILVSILFSPLMLLGWLTRVLLWVPISHAIGAVLVGWETGGEQVERLKVQARERQGR